MKKLSVLFAAIVACVMSLSAQGTFVPEITVGMNVATVNQDGVTSRIGFHAGVRGDYYFSGQDGAYLNAGLLLSLKGYKVEADWFDETVKETLNPYYLELPIHFGYKYSITDNVAVFADFGPYFAVGLFGKTEGYDVFGDDGIKRFDMGLGLRGGVEFNNKFNVSLGYDWGMLDIIDEVKVKNRNFMLSLGYKF